MTTKIHAVVDAKGLPLRFSLTPGQVHDIKAAATLLAGLPADSFVLGDKAYDADGLRHQVERLVGNLKQCRRVATRYEKLGANFLAMVKLAAIRIWLRAAARPYEPTG